MNRFLRNIAAIVAGVALSVGAVAPGLAKEAPPPPEPMKKLRFPKFREFKLKNGLDVVVVEHHEQPVATVSLVVRAGSTLDPEGKSSLASFTSALLNQGTKKHDSKELAEWIESKGGSFSASTNEDYTSLSVSILSDFLDTAWEYLSEVVREPTFPEDELEKERKRVRTGLEFEKSDPSAMADRHFYRIVYGNHPYAVRPTVETVDAVTRDDIQAFFDRNYVANNAVLFVVGDVHYKQVKRAVKKYFGDWKRGEPDRPNYVAPPERTARNIALFHRPGAVQTNLQVGHLGLRPADPDWPKIAVLNKILGGGASGRLFMDLREKHGWTYGAYSSFSKLADVGFFRATANVRTEVTDSALAGMIDNIERIVKEPVSEKELEDARSYLVGNFPTTIETPQQIASQIAQVKMLGLDPKWLETYREKVARVTRDDVLEAARAHVFPDRLAIVAVGDATKVLEKIEKIAPVSLYDIEGNPMDPAQLAVRAVDFAFDTTPLRDMKAVYSVKVQDMMDLGDMTVTLKRGDGGFETTSKIQGMLSMEESAAFSDADFAPKAYHMSMSAMGNQMSAEYTFQGSSAHGHLEGGKDGPKDVNVELVKGTVLSGALEFLIATLPLEEGASFSFPVLEAQGGQLSNADISVEGEEDVTVPAGTFSTWKVRVKSGDGETVYNVKKELPHVVVRQTVPAQRLLIELKSLEM